MERLSSLHSQLLQSPSAVILKHQDARQFFTKGTLKHKVIVITGASRGIGLAIALRCAKDGARIAILAKTAEPHPKLEGTIYTAAEQIVQAGGEALPIKCDIRFESQVQAAVDKVVQKWGGIDILVNNASGINVSDTETLEMKRYDLMMQINTRGTYLMSKVCLPFLKKAKNPHILTLSPPYYCLHPPSIRDIKINWFKNSVAYTMAKVGMTLCAYGMAEEFQDNGIAVNTLWPRTTVATAAVKFVLGGDQQMRRSRKPEIMGDAAYVILTSDSKKTTGQFYLDDEVLASAGIKDLSPYRCDPSVSEADLHPDGFC